MLDAIRRGDIAEAQELGARLQPLANVIFAPPVTDYRARTKEALKMLGILENTTVRPPLLPIPEPELETIRNALQNAGLLLSPVSR
jgi:4-hydroxy-tetrahydrodipicolinate synthase